VYESFRVLITGHCSSHAFAYYVLCNRMATRYYTLLLVMEIW